MNENKRFIAVAGAGYWGKNLVRCYHELGVLRIVYDPSSEIREKTKQNYPDVTCVDQYEDLLNNPEIKALVIASPAATHFDLVSQALNAGKHVFVEKPLALKSREGQELVELAGKVDRILFVGHILHYHPAVIHLKKLISEGLLGNLEYIYSNRLSLGKFRQEEDILWSFAPHDISLILSLVGEEPCKVESAGSSFLNPGIADVTMSNFQFPSGVRAHIFVSWLNPFKEQRLVVVGDKGMLVFEDTLPLEKKLIHYPHQITWKDGVPLPEKAEGVPIDMQTIWKEPLKEECRAFVHAVNTGERPLTDGVEGLKVLKVLEQCQNLIQQKDSKRETDVMEKGDYFLHPTATVDEPVSIGKGTKIWHYSHVLSNATVGSHCILGQNVNVASGVRIGNHVKIQNNVSLYEGVVVDDFVFLGPSCVLTNVTNPRSEIKRHDQFKKTHIKRGVSVGANATLVCGITLGRYSFVGAGAVVTKDVPDYGLMVGNPARQVGWMSRHGHRLEAKDQDGYWVCPESGFRYQESDEGYLHCLDLDEDLSLPTQVVTVG